MSEIGNPGDRDLKHKPSQEQSSWESQRKLIHEALMMLAEISPSDANLIRMHLEGCSYEEMAEREQARVEAQSEEISDLIFSIKQQFLNNRTGSMAKFKIIIKRLLEKNNFLIEC